MYERPMMIRQPAVVSADLPDTALAKTAKRFGQTVADRVHTGCFAEGRCAQLMHHGPYSHDGPNIVRLHEFVAAQGLRLRGHHHEIYLSDPRKSPAQKMLIVLRHPVDHCLRLCEQPRREQAVCNALAVLAVGRLEWMTWVREGTE